MFQSVVEMEREMIQRELAPGFVTRDCVGPDVPFVFCSPHSGRIYPTSFLAQSRLNDSAIRKSEDGFVDELFANVAALGAPLIAAQFPRAYLDLNREPYELDPLLFAEPLPDFANTRSVRVMSGLGTIARVVADNEAIYQAPLPLAVAYERIARLYRPFHDALACLLDERRRRFGHVVLVDCHSMPSNTRPDGREQRPDIVLGNRFGMSCHSELSRCLYHALRAEGFSVTLNKPYAGGFITEHYGRPLEGQDAIQLEINRALYMDEDRFRINSMFGDVRACLDRAFSQLIEAYPVGLRRADAAE